MILDINLNDNGVKRLLAPDGSKPFSSHGVFDLLDKAGMYTQGMHGREGDSSPQPPVSNVSIVDEPPRGERSPKSDYNVKANPNVAESFQLRAQEYVYLGTYAMVFQAEITAINMACLTLLDNNTTGKTDRLLH